jgi:glycosyltransferase involved in cell wall biosynthesis
VGGPFSILPGLESTALTEPGDRCSARVVLLTNFIPPYRLPLLEALADRVSGFSVLISTPVEENRHWRPETGSLDVHLQRTITIRRPRRHPAGFEDSAYVHLPWDTLFLLRRMRPDVVVSAELGFRSLFSALYCRRVPTARLVIWATLSERTEQGRGRLRLALRGWLLRQADRVIVNGASGERYIRSFGVPAERIDRIPYAASSDFSDDRRSVRVPSKIRSLLFAGQLVERKGLIPFVRDLDMWARAHGDRELELIVAGSGPEQAALEVFEAGGALRITLEGEVDVPVLRTLLEQADVLVLPTLADEWGLVVNEAMAAGVPILGSIHSEAVRELCEDGVTGWMFDPTDPCSSRRVLDRALEADPASLAAMSHRTRQRIRWLTPEWAAERIAGSISAATKHKR